jgi:hypothetical protein
MADRLEREIEDARIQLGELTAHGANV